MILVIYMFSPFTLIINLFINIILVFFFLFGFKPISSVFYSSMYAHQEQQPPFKVSVWITDRKSIFNRGIVIVLFHVELSEWIHW